MNQDIVNKMVAVRTQIIDVFDDRDMIKDRYCDDYDYFSGIDDRIDPDCETDYEERIIFGIELLGDLLTVVPNLDAVILKAIQAPGHKHKQGGWGHVCGTRHCRGGWAVMTQQYAEELVEVFGWAFAAAMVYEQSTGSIPDFYNMDDAVVLEEIKVAARRQA